MTIAEFLRGAATAAMVLTMAMPADALTLPLGWGHERAAPDAVRPSRAEPAVRLAQAGGDPVQRINQLEEDNRKLNGRVEELSFQLLQMQEQLRKIQEDNEFRFQEIEGKGAGAGKRTDATGGAGTPPPAADRPLAARTPADGTNGGAAPAASGGETTGSGDQIGDLLGEDGLDISGLGTGAGTGAPPAAAPPAGSGTVATLSPNGPGEMYDLAYNYLLAGDYQLAEQSFRQYAQTYPNAKDTPDAEYWLGESLYAQSKYTDAAETFLNAQKNHPKSPKAPEMMLKLGMSLAKLDNRDTACVTFKEVARRYPQMSANVKRKLQAESAAASC